MTEKQLVEFDIEGGGSILVEVEEPPTKGVKPIAREPGQLAAKAGKTFDESLSQLQPMIAAIKRRLDALNQPADEVEVKFGVKLSGQVGAILTSVGGEMTYEITLKWNKKQ
jgi:hypothetical protein